MATAIPSREATTAPESVSDRVQFAEALTDLRVRAGLSIRALARKTDIPAATLGGYFSGRHLPSATSADLLFAVLDALGVTDPQAHETWREALLRARRNATADNGNATAGATTGQPCPYRGLEPFTDRDADLFFGREEISDHIVTAVAAMADDPRSPGVLALVGPSGSGKSSVLRAGVVPRLRALAHPWQTAVMVPGTDPVASLTAAKEQLGDADRAVIVVDQAEELFSPALDPQQRRAFIAELVADTVERTDERTVLAVFGLRADFYGQAAREPDLLPVLRSSQILLGPMTAAELRQAVERPAQSVGVAIEPELVDLLMRDVAPHDPRQGSYEAGALPLVSHALLATWQRHTGNRLTVADYIAAGGIAGAVQQTAEGVVASLDDQGRNAAQWLFTQLVNVSDAGVMTRRRVRPDDLQHPDPATDFALDDVIEKFVAGRLLTADDHWLEISHEALLTVWPRLHEWVLTDLDTARLQRRIGEASAAWRERDKDPDALLRGGPLADARELAARPPTSPRVLTRKDQEFVAASGAQADREREERRRRTARLRSLLVVATVMAVVAATLAAVAMFARGEAQRQEQQATTARDEALSRQLAISADELRKTDPALGAQLALASYRVSPTLQARSSLLSSTAGATPTRFVGPEGDMAAAASPDGDLLAVSGVDGVTRLWQRTPAADPGAADDSAPAYEPLGEIAAIDGAEDQPVYASAFRPDGRVLAVGSSSGQIALWDVSDPGQPQQTAVVKAKAAIRSLDFTDDGAQLAAGTAEPSVRRWSLPRGTAGEPRALPPITGDLVDVQAVDFQPGGTVLATGTADGRVRLWAAGAGRPRLLGQARTGAETDFVFSVAFSPDGKTLATGDKERTVRLWDVTRPSSPTPIGKPLTEFTSWVNSVAFSPDGKTVAAGSSDGSVKVFAVAGGGTLAELPGSSAVTGVQFVAGGRSLLTSEVAGVARLWPISGTTLGGFSDSLWSLAENDTGTTLAVGPGQADGAVHLFDVAADGSTSPDTVLVPPARSGGADGAADMSVDGRWIAAGSATGKLTVWWRPKPGTAPRLAGVVTVSDVLVEATRISPDGSMVSAVADDGAVGVWSLTPGKAPKPLHQLTVPGLPLGLAFSPASDLLAVGTTDGVVHLWRLDGASAEELPSLSGFENYVYGLAFHPSGRYLAAGSTDRTVRIWDVADPARAVQVGEPLRGPSDTVYSLSWDGERDTLAGATQDGRVWLWNTRDPAAPVAEATLAVDGGLYVVALRGNSTVSAGGTGAEVVSWQTDPDEVAAATCARTGTPMTAEEWNQVAPGAPFTPPCP